MCLVEFNSSLWGVFFLFCCVPHVKVDLQVGLMRAGGESEEVFSFNQYAESR